MSGAYGGRSAVKTRQLAAARLRRRGDGRGMRRALGFCLHLTKPGWPSGPAGAGGETVFTNPYMSVPPGWNELYLFPVTNQLWHGVLPVTSVAATGRRGGKGGRRDANDTYPPATYRHKRIAWCGYFEATDNGQTHHGRRGLLTNPHVPGITDSANAYPDGRPFSIQEWGASRLIAMDFVSHFDGNTKVVNPENDYSGQTYD